MRVWPEHSFAYGPGGVPNMGSNTSSVTAFSSSKERYRDQRHAQDRLHALHLLKSEEPF